MGKAKNKDKLPRARLILNPYSGKGGNPEVRLREAEECLQRHGILVDSVTANPAERATALARAAVREGYKLIIAMGGDGTVEAAARGLIGTKGRLAILPVGTYNNVATSLGIPKELEAACRVIEEGNRRRIDVGEVRSKKHGSAFFLEAAVIGLEAAMYPVGSAIPKRKWSRLVGAVSTLIRFRLPKVKVSMSGGDRIQADSLLVVIANAPNFGSTFLVAPDASLDDGQLDVGVYAGFSKLAILAYFAEVSGERSAGSGHVQRYQARKIKIKASPRQLVMADDLRLGKGTVTIRVLPRALRVIAPEVATRVQIPNTVQKLPTITAGGSATATPSTTSTVTAPSTNSGARHYDGHAPDTIAQPAQHPTEDPRLGDR